MSRRRPGKRNRERQSKGVLQTLTWVYRGRAVIVVEMTTRGPLITRRGDSSRVNGAGKMAGAWWLNQIFEKLSHEDCYVLLWQG